MPEPSRSKHVRLWNLEAVLGEVNIGISLASILKLLFGVKEVSLALENAVGEVLSGLSVILRDHDSHKQGLLPVILSQELLSVEDGACREVVPRDH